MHHKTKPHPAFRSGKQKNLESSLKTGVGPLCFRMWLSVAPREWSGESSEQREWMCLIYLLSFLCCLSSVIVAISSLCSTYVRTYHVSCQAGEVLAFLKKERLVRHLHAMVRLAVAVVKAGDTGSVVGGITDKLWHTAFTLPPSCVVMALHTHVQLVGTQAIRMTVTLNRMAIVISSVSSIRPKTEYTSGNGIIFFSYLLLLTTSLYIFLFILKSENKSAAEWFFTKLKETGGYFIFSETLCIFNGKDLSNNE